MTIHVYGKLEEVEDRLASETLKYAVASDSKILQDFNYDKLQLVQQKNISLENELKEKEGIINCLTTNWCTGLRGDCKAVKEFYRIINTTLQLEDIRGSNILELETKGCQIPLESPPFRDGYQATYILGFQNSSLDDSVVNHVTHYHIMTKLQNMNHDPWYS